MMTQLRATLTHHHIQQKPFMSNNLFHCTHIFIWQDAIHRILQQPYHGPHKVIKREARTLTVGVSSKGGNITGSFETRSNWRFGYDRWYSYQLYTLASFISCTNSAAHKEGNSVRTTCPMALSIRSMNVMFTGGVMWWPSSTFHYLGTSVRSIQTSTN